MKKRNTSFYIVSIYFVLSFAWVLFSDKLLFSMTINKEHLTILQTFKGWAFITISSILLYFLIKKYFNKNDAEKQMFKNLFYSLSTPIIIFNEDGKVLMINDIFEDITGYKYKEIDTIEKWTNKAFVEDSAKIKKHIESLYNISAPHEDGETTLITKKEKEVIWHFTSAPLGIIDDKKTIIATALDITELKEKEKILMQQSKMAAMGEILENIAHQWRQPLSSISTASTGLKIQKEHSILYDEDFYNSLDLINKSAQHLSKTIDDFGGFFKPDQKKEFFKINHTVEKIMMIIGNKFDRENINFIKNIEDFQIINYQNVLIQVFMNIFTNSKDAFNDKGIKKRIIFIDVFND
jgi:PAS domain S-box-containing protein